MAGIFVTCKADSSRIGERQLAVQRRFDERQVTVETTVRPLKQLKEFREGSRTVGGISRRSAKARKGDDAWRPAFSVPPTLYCLL